MTPSEVAIIEVDQEGTVVHWSAGAERLFGYASREALGRHASFLRPAGCARDTYGLPERVAGQAVTQSVCAARDGRLLDVTINFRPSLDAAQNVIGVSCVVRERRVIAEDMLLELAQRFDAGFGFSMLGFGILSLAGRWLAASDSLCRILGMPQHELQATTLHALVDEGSEQERAGIERFLFGGEGNLQLPVRIRRKDGELATIYMQRSVIPDPKGQPVGLFVVVQVPDPRLHVDEEGVRTRKEIERALAASEKARRKLEALATHDPITGVLNRRGLHEAISTEQSRARRYGMSLLALLVSCDDLKAMSGALLETTQEPLLQAISHRLGALLRPGDHLAYVGDHQFLILLPDTRHAEGSLVAERLRLPPSAHGRREAVSVGKAPSLSFGVTTVPREMATVSDILALAELALRRAKSLPEAGVKGRVETRGQLQELAETLRRGTCFRAISQGIFCLADERRVGYELFSRGPEGPFEMPAEFFRLAGQLDMLPLVDSHCLKACVDAAVRLDPTARLHVNLMPRTLAEIPMSEIISIFDRAGPDRFVVEVSEQQLIGDLLPCRAAFSALKAHGVRVGIDDVGVGRGSLEALILLEPNVVKLDRQFITGIANARDLARLLGRLVEVVRSLGAETIAEGVETRADLEVVKTLGITCAQGYLWGAPA